MTHQQLCDLIERTVPLLQYMANCCGGQCDRAKEAKAILEEIAWG